MITVVGALLGGYLLMMLITRLLKEKENPFWAMMNLFMVYLACCQVAMFWTIILIFKNDLKTDMRLEVYIKHSNSSRIDVFKDDGSFMYENNGTVFARYDYSAIYDKKNYQKDLHSVNGMMESKESYWLRIAIKFIIVGVLCLVILTVLIAIMARMIISVQRYHIKFKVVYNRQSLMRTGMIMNIMKKFPYSTFMLKEEHDCAICFEMFEDDADVV